MASRRWRSSKCGNNTWNFAARTASIPSGLPIPEQRVPQPEATTCFPASPKGEFVPQIVPKGTRRLGQADEMILSLYARGLTTRDITAHLAEVYGAEVSAALVSKVTDVIADEVTSWQNRPLDECYPILYIDAIGSRSVTAGTW
ncbi:hypothetical protein ABIE67_009618 [Streptomyces sp. V4I8]